jgi:hypothetical protein
MPPAIPDNRLITAQLEKSWETALRRVEACEARLEAARSPDRPFVPPDFTGLADDLNAAWNAPGVTMSTRQQLLRALVTDIIACQTASNRDPGSASKRDPSPALGQACPGSEQEGPARVAQCPHERRSGALGGACLPTGASRGGTQARCLKRQLSLPVSMISQ